MAVQTISLEFCSEPVDIHCPVCGQPVFVAGQQQEACCHVVFISDSTTESWSWQQEHYRADFNHCLQHKYAHACKNGFYGSFEEYREKLRADQAAETAAEIVSGKSIFRLSVSTSDIGCGGMYNGTIQVIFDYLSSRPKLISIR